MRPGSYAISINYRRTNDSLLQNILKTIFYDWPAGFLIREVLTKCKTYDEAVGILSNSHLIAPCYFTVAGIRIDEHKNKKQCACILIRNREGLHRKEDLDDEDHKQYIVQTNHDKHGLKTENIVYSHERVDAVNELMKNTLNVVSPGYLLDSLTEFPIINEETIYTVQMIPELSYHKTRVFV